MNRLFKGILLLFFITNLFIVSVNAQTPGHPAPLPNRTMINLSGHQKQDVIELKGTLSASHTYNTLIIERGSIPGVFEQIIEINIAGTASSEYKFTYQDMHPESGINYYRIKLLNKRTQVHEMTNTLMIKMDNESKDLEIINTVIESDNPVITIKSNEDDQASIQTVDMYGRTLKTEQCRINNGTNNITLPGLVEAKGFFIIIVKTSKEARSQRVLVQ